MLGVPLQLSELERAGRQLMRQVDRLLLDQPQLRDQVERMLNMMNVTESESGATDDDEEPSTAPSESAAPDPNIELPSTQAVMSEVEELLKQFRRQDPGTTDGGGPSGQ
jgi:hypothetical protein